MKRKIILPITLALIVALSVTGLAFASAVYYGSWSEQPYAGDHAWRNNNPDGGSLTWDVSEYWSSAGALALQNGHNNWPYKEYRIEQEAYNPGSGSQCDRLSVSSYTTYGLPVTGWSLSNGCGSSTYQEELKIELNENSVSAGIWYSHRVVYTKIDNCGSAGNGEVNYSFSHNWTTSDSWLGKINYNNCFYFINSDPVGMGY